MSARQILLGTMVATTGLELAGAATWGLLNVPESSVPALLLSAVLAVLVPVILGLTTSVVLGITGGLSLPAAARRALPGLRGFAAGLVVLGVLWVVTTRLVDLWVAHAGEIDALFLRYAGTASTAWLHTTVGWLLWLLCWGVGLAAIVGATRAAVHEQSLLTGLARAFSVRVLGTALGALLVGYALWSVVFWRPKGLPDNSAELMFVGAKLLVLYLVATVASVVALAVAGGGTEKKLESW